MVLLQLSWSTTAGEGLYGWKVLSVWLLLQELLAYPPNAAQQHVLLSLYYIMSCLWRSQINCICIVGINDDFELLLWESTGATQLSRLYRPYHIRRWLNEAARWIGTVCSLLSQYWKITCKLASPSSWLAIDSTNVPCTYVGRACMTCPLTILTSQVTPVTARAVCVVCLGACCFVQWGCLVSTVWALFKGEAGQDHTLYPLSTCTLCASVTVSSFFHVHALTCTHNRVRYTLSVS